MKLEILHKGEVIQTLELAEGSYRIGRTTDCDIRLRSSRVSKEHGLFVVKGKRTAVVDTGSSNGIFVNGVLVKKERVRIGDDVAIAEFKLVLVGDNGERGEAPPSPSEVAPDMDRLVAPDMGNLAQDLAVAPPQESPEPYQEPVGRVEMAQEVSPQERLLKVMDERFLTPLYGLMKHVDWRVLLSVVLIFTLVLSVLLSVVPIFRWGKGIASNEALNRAHTVLKQLVRENYRILRASNNDFIRLTVDAAEREEGFVSAYIVDPRSKSIYAPSKLFNKTIKDIYFLLALKKIKSGEKVVSLEKRNGVFAIGQPIYVFSQESNENELKAVALAEFAVPDGLHSTVEPLVEAALFSVLLSLIAYFVIMKMVTIPIIRMREQLDSAMKGEAVSIDCESNFMELQDLARDMNFSISRLRQAEGGASAALETSDADAEDAAYVLSVEEFDQTTSDAILLLDKEKKVRVVGKAMEELINLRPQYAIGQNISEACRDAGFAGTCVELCERVVQQFGEAQVAELDVNGINRSITAIGHKNNMGEVQFILVVVKLGE